ncbi:MAG: HTTM domain-containing protein, partial [Bacteroidota bacterium]|nr:HTTM domain-containing protein [Bacteroidota bacterium]
QFLESAFHFKYFGFHWVSVAEPNVLYGLFFLLMISALCVAFGLLYRISALLFFVLFTYFELLDATFYLNHYYFISCCAFLLIFLPAHYAFSLDQKLFGWKPNKEVAAWTIYALRIQFTLLYFFAGIAKIQPDWLLEAMPLSIWLKARTDLPLIGPLLDYEATAYLMSWGGMLFDVLAGFLLLIPKTRTITWIMAAVFHGLTAIIFPQIGVFPYVMIVGTLVYFPWTKLTHRISSESSSKQIATPLIQSIVPYMLSLYFMLQVFIPLRHHLYSGNLFWHEQGFRFSWRVMLMEKAGYCEFEVVDTAGDRRTMVRPSDHLNPQQEKMMATQPDMILQYAHYLSRKYSEDWQNEVEVYAHCWCSLNGRGSTPYINSDVNLAKEKDSFSPKTWILPFE